MIDLFHGTTPVHAKDLYNCKIDVDLGGGEFGKGFYLGTSKRLAKRRAFHKTEGIYGTAQNAVASKNNTFKVTIELPLLYAFYRKRLLDRDQARKLFQQLKKDGCAGSYSFGPSTDIVEGPVVGGKGRYLSVTQLKFDTKRSENVLNKQCPLVTIVTKVV